MTSDGWSDDRDLWRRLGEALLVEDAPALVTRPLRTADMAVTESRSDNPLPQIRGPLPPEEVSIGSQSFDADPPA